ncbi:MAG: SGNH/GDSL hydrolase family protein [Clostridia bacterium]|nr:SGNH/GDSL hydrolase family protein [Clostridia bacterium]
MKKLIIFGDSILKGVIYSREGKMYKLYNGSLTEKLRAKGVELLSYCKMGLTVTKAFPFVSEILEGTDDLRGTDVLLEYGGNDSMFNWKMVSEAPDGVHCPVTSPDDFAATYDRLIKKLQARGANVILANLIPIDPEKYMNYISEGLSRENILRWLGDISMLYRFHESYNRKIYDLAAENKAGIVDLREDFLLAHDFSELLCMDGIHPTDKGHAMIENTLVRSFGA